MAGTLSVQELGAVFRRFWIVIVVATLLGGTGGYGVASLQEKTFSATATQLVKGLPGSQAAANYQAAQYAISRAKSYPAFIDSTRVLDAVRADLGDSEDINQLAQDLSATNPVDTPLIQVTALGRTPEQARDKANSAARHLASFITQIETVSGSSPVSVETAVQAVLVPDPIAPRPKIVGALAAFLLGCLAFAAAIVISRSARLSELRSRRADQRKRPARPPVTPTWEDPPAPTETDASSHRRMRDRQRSSAAL